MQIYGKSCVLKLHSNPFTWGHIWPFLYRVLCNLYFSQIRYLNIMHCTNNTPTLLILHPQWIMVSWPASLNTMHPDLYEYTPGKFLCPYWISFRPNITWIDTAFRFYLNLRVVTTITIWYNMYTLTQVNVTRLLPY